MRSRPSVHATPKYCANQTASFDHEGDRGSRGLITASQRRSHLVAVCRLCLASCTPRHRCRKHLYAASSKFKTPRSKERFLIFNQNFTNCYFLKFPISTATH